MVGGAVATGLVARRRSDGLHMSNGLKKPADGMAYLDAGPSDDVSTETLAHMRALFAHHPGPALLFDPAAHAYGLNEAGESLADQLTGDGGVSLMPQLVQLAVKARIAGTGLSREVPMPGGRARLEATVLPQADGTLLVLGRDSTLEASIRTALAESRTRFKDLVDLAADFAWETDIDGGFSFISARGALGYPPEALAGSNPRDLLADPDSAPTLLPFDALEAVRNVELWMRAADGDTRCLLVSAAPVRTNTGARVGARGIAIDVTLERRQQSELAELKTRERLVQYILDALRGEVAPEQMLSSAAHALGRAASADGCILSVLEGGRTVREARYGNAPDAATVAASTAKLFAEDGVLEGETPRHRWIGVAPRHTGEPVGAILLWRTAQGGAWEPGERRVLEAVEQHFAIAFRQIGDQLQLERLSRTDELTGLANRRAFFDDLARALERCVRRGDGGALLYIDLDNFKPINDHFGHQAGDRILRALGQALRHGTRGYDLIARLGGDEFAVWLEGASAEIAERRAHEFLSEIADLRGLIADAAAAPDGRPEAVADALPPLAASIGVALIPSGRIAADQKMPDVGLLLAAADGAMYRAKDAGKGGVRFADPIRPEDEGREAPTGEEERRS